MEKNHPTEEIEKIIIGGKDGAGNLILQVLATGNEYAIYEIETHDINNRLKVTIDGHTDESEQKIIERFVLVKQKYIEAKGLLYRSQNFGMMKNRVAHALASALSSENDDRNEAFISLINDIKSEAEAVVWNRAAYFSPILSSVVGAFFLLYYGISDVVTRQIIITMLGASLGGSLSILVTLYNRHFEEFHWYHYFMLGVERMVLAYIAAAIAFSLIKAGLVLPTLSISETWMMLSIAIIAGFSEQLVPSLVSKIGRE